MNTTSASDSLLDLLNGSNRGDRADRDALVTRLWEMHSRSLYWHLKAEGRTDASDIVQSGFLKFVSVLQGRSVKANDRDHLRALLRSMIRDKLLDRRRREARRRDKFLIQRESDGPACDEDDQAALDNLANCRDASTEYHRLVDEILDAVTDDTLRQILILKLGDHAFVSIAKEMKYSDKWVRDRWKEIVQVLFDRFDWMRKHVDSNNQENG